MKWGESTERLKLLRALSASASTIVRAASERLACGVALYAVAGSPEQVLVTIEVHEVDPGRRGRLEPLWNLRFRRGEHLPGRVWEVDRGILIPDVDVQALCDTGHPVSRRLVLEFQVRSRMLAPVRRSGRVIGVLDAVRCGDAAPPFSESDFEYLQQVACALSAGPEPELATSMPRSP